MESEPCPVPTQDSVSALQLVGVFSLAEVVDEVSELVDVLQALGHHHLLMDQVGLGQVGAGLDTENKTINTRAQLCTRRQRVFS